MISEKALICKHNNLINASYKLNLGQHRLILVIASMINPFDKDFKEYELSIDDFAKILNIDVKKYKSFYSKLKRESSVLLSKRVTIHEKDGDLQSTWFASIKYFENEGRMAFTVAPRLKKYYLQLNSYYTKYRLYNIANLKSQYSLRIYEILKQYENVNTKILSLETFKMLIGLEDNQYSRFYDFKKNVLEVSKEELIQKTDLKFDYEIIKESRHVKGIKFNIYSNKNNNFNDELDIKNIEIMNDNVEENSITVAEDEIEPINEIPEDPKEKENDEIIFLKNLFDNKLKNFDCAKILAVAKGDLDKIKEAYNLALQQPKINNLCGWLIDCLKKNYSIPVAVTNINNRQIDVFNDFEQREYDFDELEKKLLGWDTEDENNIDPEKILINFLDELKESGINGENFYYYNPIDFYKNEVHGTLNGTLMAFKYTIENNIVSLINASTNEIISNKKNK